jgi:sugar phosphate isomerase/epimerase
MTLADSDLVLCAGTLANTALVDRIEPTAMAGFQGLSVFTTDIVEAAAVGISISELRARIEDAGLGIAEVDPLASWFPSAVEGDGLLGTSLDEVLRIASELSARSITAVVFAKSPPSRDELTECFAALCDRAAEHDLQVHLEFIPFTPVRTLKDALAIVGAADRPNGGIMLDAWHLCKSGGTAADVEAAAGRILGVQLDDTADVGQENLVDETMHRRLLPGEGIAGVPEIIRALRTGGSSAPLGVEVFSDVLMALEPTEVASRAFRATRSCIAEST